MSAGRKRDKIGIERATVVQDAYGEETPTWGLIGQEWAEVGYGRGDERRQAAMEQGQLPATFVVWDNTLTRSVGLKDRLTHDGGVWDVTRNVQIRPGEREFTATRAV